MKSMHLTPLGPNITEVRYGENYVLFSYQEAVAYSDKTGACFKTSKKWSKTTSSHISKWLNGRQASEVSQHVIDQLVK